MLEELNIKSNARFMNYDLRYWLRYRKTITINKNQPPRPPIRRRRWLDFYFTASYKK